MPAVRNRPVAAAEAADQSRLDAQTAAIAAATAVTLAGSLALSASRRASAVANLPPAEAAAKVREHLQGLSGADVTYHASGATMHSYGSGRSEFMRANPPDVLYGSELMDENTCGPCGDIDGTEYATLAESENDYPFGGGYVDCEGGLRCRGMIVAEYGSSPPDPEQTPPVEVSPEEFHAAIAPALRDPNAGPFLTDYSAEDYAGMRVFLANGGRTGAALKNGNELVSLFNRGPKGAGAKMVNHLIDQGARQLDAVGTDLADYYERFGFRTYKTEAWDPAYPLPPSWEKGPNVYYMRLPETGGEPADLFPPRRPAPPGETAPAPLGGEPAAPAGVDEAQQAVDSVVRVDHLKIEDLPDGDSATARFSPERNTISVHPDGSPRTITNAVTHEYGHYTDRVLGGGDDYLTSTKAGDPIFQLLKNSPTMQAVRNDEYKLLEGDYLTRNYFLQGREMFARAFHQYVATRSADPLLLEELQNVRGDAMLSFQFWGDEEFKPIAAELDRLLAEAGIAA